ncbi:FeoB small GTPase domain-containing protein, partial [Chromohalobacter sp. HP20-39]|uniref:FeoB small GTPase domain-containing protein n=1 Tax=Chromohalobacter sp. HP20-39 TaxID=3079306 RepID=UPI00294B8B8A
VALVGNPNCGKTALFNLLTGSRQKVANYAGVTVERKEGRFTAPSGRHVQILDLPGAYSLVATSPDEAITRDICLGTFRGEPRPDMLICVVDATNLRLHLRFVLELQRLGLPMVLALNMVDAAERRGIRIDRAKLEAALADVINKHGKTLLGASFQFDKAEVHELVVGALEDPDQGEPFLTSQTAYLDQVLGRADVAKQAKTSEAFYAIVNKVFVDYHMAYITEKDRISPQTIRPSMKPT